MQLKDNLRFLRKKAGLTQGKLAKKMRLKQYNISDYEIGRIEPSIATLCRFADIFNVSIDFLVGRKTKEEQKEVTEETVTSYISDMSVDKYLIKIYDNIKDLPAESKKQVVDSVKFVVNNLIARETPTDIDSEEDKEEK
ncbi:MAG: helix-turn-helix transcriptional regulator [Bacilli bacterium]